MIVGLEKWRWTTYFGQRHDLGQISGFWSQNDVFGPITHHFGQKKTNEKLVFFLRGLLFVKSSQNLRKKSILEDENLNVRVQGPRGARERAGDLGTRFWDPRPFVWGPHTGTKVSSYWQVHPKGPGQGGAG